MIWIGRCRFDVVLQHVPEQEFDIQPLLTHGEFNDLVQDLCLSKIASELLGSFIKVKNFCLLESSLGRGIEKSSTTCDSKTTAQCDGACKYKVGRISHL